LASGLEDEKSIVEGIGVRVLVCGSRHYCNYRKIFTRLANMKISLIIAGGARGADTLAVRAAKECGFSYAEYPADWERYGKKAGPIRNQQMLDMGKPDFVLAFHDDVESSKGTKDMILRAKKAGIPFEVVS
jgi:hypothetical protein